MTEQTLLVMDGDNDLRRVWLSVDEDKIHVYDYSAKNIYDRVCGVMSDAVEDWLRSLPDSDLEAIKLEGLDDCLTLFMLPDLIGLSTNVGYPGLKQALEGRGLYNLEVDYVGSDQICTESDDDYFALCLSDIIHRVKEEREDEEVVLP